MTNFQKSISIDLMEFNRNTALMEDADYIAFIEGDYYEEVTVKRISSRKQSDM